MNGRPLGRTGLQVSEMGLGCWALGGNSYGTVRDENSLEALETAWDAGVNFFDTADVYGEGHSEVLIGKFLEGKPREKVFIATKAGWDFYPVGSGAFGREKEPAGRMLRAAHRKNFDPLYLRFACERSLERLSTGTIDLYQLHNPSLEQIRAGAAVGVLEVLKKEGKIRFIGISVHTEAEALAALEDPRVDALQVIYNLLDQRMRKRVFPEALRRGVGILAREPLASGLLSEKYPPEHHFPKNDHRRRWTAEKRTLDWEKIRKLKAVLKGGTVSLRQAALEYVLNYKEVSAVIPGAKTAVQVTENLKASVAPLMSPEAFAAIQNLYETEPAFGQGLVPR